MPLPQPIQDYYCKLCPNLVHYVSLKLDSG